MIKKKKEYVAPFEPIQQLFTDFLLCIAAGDWEAERLGSHGYHKGQGLIQRT